MMCPARTVRAAVLLLLLLCGARATAHIEQAFACFVYIEPYEVRVEFITTTASLGMPLNYGFDGIDTDEQQALAEDAGRRLAEAFELRADGTLLSFKEQRFGFVTKDDETDTVVPDERELIPINEARISGIFVCPRDRLPRSIEIKTRLFENQRQRSYRQNVGLPVFIELLTPPSEREMVITELTEDSPRYAWHLPPTAFSPSLADTATPPPPSYTLLHAAGALGLGGLVICIAPFWKNRPRLAAGAIALIAGVGVGTLSMQRGFATPIEEDQAEATIQTLLTNVYYAFAYRDESKIFDTLATSADGPLLEALYLDIQRGLSDAENGGPSVRVLGVELVDCEVEQSNSERLHARVRWVSSGTVSHWGHAHERRNRYRAEVVAEPVDGRWRLTGVTILEEERVE